MSEVIVKLKHLHPAQKAILTDARRFNVLKCGRRFGKTELTKELTIQPMLDGKIVGYWCPTYKDLSEVWNELKFTLGDVIRSKNEQLKEIQLITGGKLDMWSLDDPDSGRGRKYHVAIIDEAEKAAHLKEAWEQTIRATLVDFKGSAWFMSTPKFGQTYFKTTLFQNEKKSDQWKSFLYTSFDNPFLDPAEIEDARKLDELVFRCEYLAEDVDLVSKPFAYCFDEAKHVQKCEYDPSYELMLSFDFNVDPITCVCFQHIDDQIRFFKEFKLSNSNIFELCDQINVEFGSHNPLYVVTGDATGASRNASSVIDSYRTIKQKLDLSNNQMRVPTVNPSVNNSRVLLNSLLQNYSVIFDPDGCPNTILDMKYVQVDDEGDIVKDRKDETRKADLLDCVRYACYTHFKWFIKSLNT